MSERFFGTYKLDEDEIADRSQQMAQCLSNLEMKTLEKASVTSKLNGEIKGLNELLAGLKRQVLEGKETAYFDCEVVIDRERGIKTFYYNSQRLGSRPLTENEKQLHMRDAL